MNFNHFIQTLMQTSAGTWDIKETSRSGPKNLRMNEKLRRRKVFNELN